jgi:hypothetical protein
MAFPFLLDWNNPTAPAPRPSQGSKINYVDEPANPGIKAILDQYTDEFKSLALNMDASVAGRGLQFGNIANRAIQAENYRPLLWKPYSRKPFAVGDGTGQQRIQVDGQAIFYTELFKVQFGTGFRNFQVGVDNITTELILELTALFWQASSTQSALGWNYAPAPYAGTSNYDDYLPNRLVLDVSSNANFTDAVTLDDWGIDPNGNYKTLTHRVWDTPPKAYQNPWYRLRHYQKKTPAQSIGISNYCLMVGTLDLSLQAWNKGM